MIPHVWARLWFETLQMMSIANATQPAGERLRAEVKESEEGKK